MAAVNVTLSSGRVVELHEPTFGEELAIVGAAHDNVVELVYAKCAVIAPGISRQEIDALPREDGHLLIRAVGNVWDGRPEDQEVPFGNGSRSPSTDSAAQAIPETT